MSWARLSGCGFVAETHSRSPLSADYRFPSEFGTRALIKEYLRRLLFIVLATVLVVAAPVLIIILVIVVLAAAIAGGSQDPSPQPQPQPPVRIVQVMDSERAPLADLVLAKGGLAYRGAVLHLRLIGLGGEGPAGDAFQGSG